MKLTRYRNKSEKKTVIEETFECKNCGAEITKSEYKSNNKLCSGCFNELYDEFAGEND